METPLELYDKTYMDFVKEVATMDLASDDMTTAMKNFETYSKVRPSEPELEPVQPDVPTTFLGKLGAGLSRVWNNETTQIFGKAAIGFAGVYVVAHQTIQKERVLERQAMNQANQRNS